MITTKPGTSVNGGPHYQKLFARVTHIWSNRKGQPDRSAMRGPHLERTASLITVPATSGKFFCVWGEWPASSRVSAMPPDLKSSTNDLSNRAVHQHRNWLGELNPYPYIHSTGQNKYKTNIYKTESAKNSGSPLLKSRVFDPVIIEGKEVELVTGTNVLGLTIANNITWNDLVTEITKNASKRLFPNLVKESGSSETRSSTVLHIVRGICYWLCSTCLFQWSPQYLKKELVWLKKRAISIITSQESATRQ